MTRKDHKLAVEVVPGRRFRHDGELLEEGDIVVLAAKEARQMVACGHCLPARMPMAEEDPNQDPCDHDEGDATEGAQAPEQADPVPPLIDQPPAAEKASE
ncbi:hypothetical protein [Gluconobacter oxydans]|uniref:hypothetical protein n=1 Tax=Gluconobacter oxydans TaxID=442 RepID=UPI00078505AF|nr:hypothetical protein [Gluconobacter oxydans]KXV65643.1 hypothetical protein AD950_04130 [Gluconobacter oxydans]